MFFAQRYRKQLERLIGEWTDYRTLVLNRMGAKDLRAEEEKRFLGLKGKIAEDMTALTLWLPPNLAQEVQAHMRGIHALLGRYPTLFSDRPLDETLRADFERDWHDHFLFFNRLKGMKPNPEARDPRGASVRAQTFSGTEAAKKPVGGTRFATVMLRLAFLVFVVALFVRVLPWELLKTPAGGDRAAAMRSFILGIGDRFQEMFSGVRPPSLGGVLDPVVEAYGSEVTTILFGAFILVVGYFLFVRMK